MYGDELVREFKTALHARMEAIAGAILRGAADDYPAYRGMLGTYHGLRDAMELLKEAEKKEAN